MVKLDRAYRRYLGTLGLLGECSVYVPEDLRGQIEMAMEDACAADNDLTWRRTLNRIVIEVKGVDAPKLTEGGLIGQA